MSSDKTTNLALHKWAGTDPVERTEFNDNFGIIDVQLSKVNKSNTEWLSVKSFGAKGDCILDVNGNYVSGTDDTQSILSAITNAPANGTVVFPPGKYYYHYINVTRNDITVIGYGASLVSYMQPETAKNTFHIIGSNISVYNMDFRFDRPFDYDTTFKPTAYSNGNPIRLGGSKLTDPNGGWQQNIVIDGCTVNGGYGGGIDVYWANNVRVSNCKVRNTLGNGINFSNCQKNVLVENNIVENTRDDGIQNVCDADWAVGTRNHIVRNNRVTNSYGKGISTTGVDGSKIIQNYVENTWGGGIQPFKDTFYSLGDSKNVDVIDNTIVDAGKNYGPGKYKTTRSGNADGIYLSSAVSYIKLKDNRIITPSRHGITLISGVKEIDIVSNRIKGCGGHGITIGDITDTTYTSAFGVGVEDNSIEDVGESGIIVGGVDEARIGRNRVKDWGNSNYPIYIKNSRYVDVFNNRVNNPTKGLATSIIRVEGALPNVTVGNGNLLMNSAANYPKDSIVVGSRRIAFSDGRPTAYKWTTGDAIFNNSAVAGGKAGFWVIRSGNATPSWSASTTYAVGDTVVPTSDNGSYYTCVVAGTSNSTQPTFPTSAGATVLDGTVTWQQSGAAALFKAWGVIDA
ncbi:hypothetical protein PghCCS26_47890 [Paenibacillus glycanilyticus]|uniref:Right handed beta helix domain-containing protein n=1 Tax=Paenibacillus glycanilyticus TaxID=126569 RepID=A0ABQ6NT03_9BACL|nr:right-handed parallel beta-helix repeat-containing protein [Paenibacillus glycanilyticus]GMK47659.1 hypothetical protein PghCCS26_47890 [Paenibacillus glycanilyticus]